MSDGYDVDVEQIRSHAGRIETLAARFGAIRDASAHIVRDDTAYGLLCGWISGVLEGRHVRQDELIAYVEENLWLAAESLYEAADNYEDTDWQVADRFDQIKSRLPGGAR